MIRNHPRRINNPVESFVRVQHVVESGHKIRRLCQSSNGSNDLLKIKRNNVNICYQVIPQYFWEVHALRDVPAQQYTLHSGLFAVAYVILRPCIL